MQLLSGLCLAIGKPIICEKSSEKLTNVNDEADIGDGDHSDYDGDDHYNLFVQESSLSLLGGTMMRFGPFAEKR